MKKFLKNPFIILILILILYAVVIRPVGKYALNGFGNMLGKAFGDFLEERRQAIDNGEVYETIYTKLIWGKHYEIYIQEREEYLSIVTKDTPQTDILKKITHYQVIEDKLYVISNEGYAVIDNDEQCRMFVNVPEEDFINGYRIDENGNKIYNIRRVDSSCITYLKSFDEFSKDEQKIFNKLKK